MEGNVEVPTLRRTRHAAGSFDLVSTGNAGCRGPAPQAAKPRPTSRPTLACQGRSQDDSTPWPCAPFLCSSVRLVGSRKDPQSRWLVPLPQELRSTMAVVVQSMAAASAFRTREDICQGVWTIGKGLLIALGGPAWAGVQTGACTPCGEKR